MEANSVLDKWHNGVHIAQVAHNMAAARYSRLHRFLGIPVVILSTAVGTSIFASLDSSSISVSVKVVVGAFSVAAAIFSSLQTFFGFAELAEKNKHAAVQYGELRREMQQVIAFPPHDAEKREAFLVSFRSRWDSVEKESPTIAQSLYDAAREYGLPKQESKSAHGSPSSSPNRLGRV